MVRDPTRVTFAYAPAADEPDLGLVHDHAYWVSGLTPAPGGPGRGAIDARSFASGEGEPRSRRRDGGGHGPLPYSGFARTWAAERPSVAAGNRLTVRLTGLEGARLDLGHAGLDLAGPVVIEITSDTRGVLDVGDRDVAYGAGVTRRVLEPAPDLP